MMWNKIQLLFIIVHCHTIHTYYNAKVRKHEFKKLQPITIPPELNSNVEVEPNVLDHFLPNNATNKQFCARMSTEQVTDRPVLPWWYRYCFELLHEDSSIFDEVVDFKALEMHIADELEAYNKWDKQVEAESKIKPNELE